MKCKFQSEYESYTFILAFVRNRDLSAILLLYFIKFGVIAGELCQFISKCNWKIKKRRCVEFTIYLNVPKNKLEVHVYSHKFVLCLISKTTLLLPEFPLFRFKLYGVVLPYSIQCMQPVIVDITPNAR